MTEGKYRTMGLSMAELIAMREIAITEEYFDGRGSLKKFPWSPLPFDISEDGKNILNAILKRKRIQMRNLNVLKKLTKKKRKR